MKRAGRTFRGAGRCAPLIIASEGTDSATDLRDVYITDKETHPLHILARRNQFSLSTKSALEQHHWGAVQSLLFDIIKHYPQKNSHGTQSEEISEALQISFEHDHRLIHSSTDTTQDSETEPAGCWATDQGSTTCTENTFSE